MFNFPKIAPQRLCLFCLRLPRPAAAAVDDHGLVSQVHDAERKITLRKGIMSEKVLEQFIKDMKKTTGVTRDIRVADVFDFSFARKINRELKRWKP